jgi:lycopene cyclase domain-containing protein
LTKGISVQESLRAGTIVDVTYLQFLLIFLGVPLVLLVLIGRHAMRRVPWALLTLLAVVALVYTGPWDHAIIAAGVWAYPAKRVLGLAIGLVPIEEYTFYVLQVILTGIVTTMLLAWRRTAPQG